VRGLVVGDDAKSGRAQRVDEVAHLRGATTPAVREHDGRRILRPPMPERETASAVHQRRGAPVAQVWQRIGRSRRRRRQEQPLGKRVGERRL